LRELYINSYSGEYNGSDSYKSIYWLKKHKLSQKELEGIGSRFRKIVGID